jgi:hypothetical protein
MNINYPKTKFLIKDSIDFDLFTKSRLHSQPDKPDHERSGITMLHSPDN